jgi:predicted TPR repeat methyltransferase
MYARSFLLQDGDPEKLEALTRAVDLFDSCYRQSRKQADLVKAICVLEDTLALTPDGHPNYGDRLVQLGTYLLLRNQYTRTSSDVDRAISVLESSVKITPNDDADKPNRLNNLGTSFSYRFERTGALADINKAVSAHEDAVCLTPEGHSSKHQEKS